jgi:hypothetical protein
MRRVRDKWIVSVIVAMALLALAPLTAMAQPPVNVSGTINVGGSGGPVNAISFG